MADREQLRSAGLRAYERGRMRMAARVSFLLVPAMALCALATGEPETCGCVGVLLLGAAVALRWRNRWGVESVSAGIRAGTLPMVAGLVAARCGGAGAQNLASACCAMTGVIAGAWLGARAPRLHIGVWAWSVAIAVLVASLGCVGSGVMGVVAAGTGLAVGTMAGVLGVRALGGG